MCCATTRIGGKGLYAFMSDTTLLAVIHDLCAFYNDPRTDSMTRKYVGDFITTIDEFLNERRLRDIRFSN